MGNLISAIVGGMLVLSATAADKSQLTFQFNAGAELRVGGQRLARIAPGYFSAGWSHGGFASDFKDVPEGAPLRASATRNGVVIDLVVRDLSVDGSSASMVYEMTPQKDISLNALFVGVVFDVDDLVGRPVQIDDSAPVIFPAERGETQVLTKKAQKVIFDTAKGALALVLAEPTSVMLQDDRAWGPTATLRIGLNQDPPATWEGGKTLRVAMTLTAPLPIVCKRPGAVVLTANDEWLPLQASLGVEPGSAVDFSVFGLADGPAGKYGKVVRNGRHFEFERQPGKAQRFYGVNLCFMAQYLEDDQAVELAERLYRLGYNTVRFHHHESNLQDRSQGDSVSINPVRQAQFDRLFAELKKRGIYMTTDTYVSRKVFAKEIWPDATGDVSMNDMKMLLPVNDAAFANWVAFTRNFLGHVNPHTGLTLAQDPALAWISLINEGNFGNFIGALSGRVKDEWLRAWNDWLGKRYASVAARNQAWGREADAVLADLPTGGRGTVAERRDFDRFQLDVATAMYRKMTAFLRDELGCQALFTDMNSWTSHAWTQLYRSEFDYVDEHFYVDHPVFLQKSWQLPSTCGNASPVKRGEPGGGHTAYLRLLDRPFAISEYNYSGPGRYRGVGGILTGCMAALQDWAAIWRFAYSHGGNMFEMGFAGYFDMASDPLNQAAERATLCLFMRGDMSPASRTIAISLAKDHYDSDDVPPAAGVVPSWSSMNTVAIVGSHVGPAGSAAPADVSVAWTDAAPKAPIALPSGNPGSGETRAALQELFRERGWLPAENSTDFGARISQSTNGEFTMNGRDDIMVLDTLMTAGGFAPAGKRINTRAVDIAILDTDATVWVSSLDKEPISRSRRLLVTHLTDLQNEGRRFAEEERRTVLSWGKMPYLVRAGRAELLVKMTEPEKATVWRIATNGKRIDQLKATVTPEGLLLPLDVKGPQGAQMMYEIVK
ncbi:hypothetical protein [Oligosphaera ethanolica]|uniref:Glycoside hydrolase family 42 N-terminal domain-containing protein n=1 Tax=Oligosphaera ethanolica TaxID=760260 RepID=A0AAE3VGF4_9BACT|nr:hypothetical protein [Oligosphaera ethanolica]MDQ0290012.1 hypothetical protein [Oligosphaera ethanolica]